MEVSISEGFLDVREGAIYWTYATVARAEEEPRPVLLFIHAGIADHTSFDDQVEFLVRKGWNCLRFDALGFGQSHASEEYLTSHPREPFNPIEHLDLLRAQILPPDVTVIPVGVSVGASLALGYTVNRPDVVSAAVIVSGGLGGFEYPNTPAEDGLFKLVESLVSDGDVQGAANLQVRIWGDGPLQEPGRLREDVAERLLAWNTDIARREFAKTGGFALDTVELETPASTQLHNISVPIAIGYGTFDETYTQVAMKHVAANVRGAASREFQTAHLINLEVSEEFNLWLGEWLDTHFKKSKGKRANDGPSSRRPSQAPFEKAGSNVGSSVGSKRSSQVQTPSEKPHGVNSVVSNLEGSLGGSVTSERLPSRGSDGVRSRGSD